jgi:hypothetical protein
MARGVVIEVAFDLLHLPLVGFVSVPLIRHPSLASTPNNVAAVFGLPGAPWSTRSVLVVSHHLDGLLRARISGLIASRYRKGFAAFLHRAVACRPAFRRRPARIRTYTTLSRCALHTPRRSPPASSRSASLRSLPPRRCACTFHMNKFTFPPPTLDLEALLHCRVRSTCRPLPVDWRPLLPWAWFPSRVLGEWDNPTRRVSASAQLILAAGSSLTLP